MVDRHSFRIFSAFVFLLIGLSSQTYIEFQDKVNWYQAMINCIRSGMELASIHSEQEQKNFQQFLMNGTNSRTFWISATKEGSRQYYWATTGAKMLYTKWLNGQPDNGKYQINYYEGEHCVQWIIPEYNGESMGWNDVTCHSPSSYVCQTRETC